MDDDTILDVRVSADDDGLHVIVCIDLVCTDNGVRSNEDILVDDHSTTENSRWIDESAVMDDREIATRIPADHLDSNPVFIADMV